MNSMFEQVKSSEEKGFIELCYFEESEEVKNTKVDFETLRKEKKYQTELIKLAKDKINNTDDDTIFDPYTCFDEEKGKKAEEKTKDPRLRKLIVCIAKGEFMLGVVLNIVLNGPSGEFDSFYIERIKSTIQLFYEERLFKAFDQAFHSQSITTPFHNFANKDLSLYV
jgi:hypothetical protein